MQKTLRAFFDGVTAVGCAVGIVVAACGAWYGLMWVGWQLFGADR